MQIYLFIFLDSNVTVGFSNHLTRYIVTVGNLIHHIHQIMHQKLISLHIALSFCKNP